MTKRVTDLPENVNIRKILGTDPMFACSKKGVVMQKYFCRIAPSFLSPGNRYRLAGAWAPLNERQRSKLARDVDRVLRTRRSRGDCFEIAGDWISYRLVYDDPWKVACYVRKTRAPRPYRPVRNLEIKRRADETRRRRQSKR